MAPPGIPLSLVLLEDSWPVGQAPPPYELRLVLVTPVEPQSWAQAMAGSRKLSCIVRRHGNDPLRRMSSANASKDDGRADIRARREPGPAMTGSITRAVKRRQINRPSRIRSGRVPSAGLVEQRPRPAVCTGNQEIALRAVLDVVDQKPPDVVEKSADPPSWLGIRRL